MTRSSPQSLLLSAAALLGLLLLFSLVVCNATSSNKHNYIRSLSSSASKDYYLWPSEEIRNTLLKWADLYPEFVRVTTSQQEFGLPAAGTDEDCPFDKGKGCNNYILTIQDYTVHPQDSDSSNKLAEVLWSGSVHGNERVGPTATMEAASLLLQAASCEAKPNKSFKQQHGGHALNNKDQSWEQQVAAAKKCRQDLEQQGISSRQRQWLARLVTTRRIVILPSANALGYYRNVREEGDIDPNRDFPFDVQDATKCMQTIAGRTLNEVFRQHMIQLSLTFHGGMEVVAYEWGAPTYLNFQSPDDQAQHDVASAYSQYGGGWKESHPYDFGTMNDLVYYVRGGMEDWAYAASFDPERVIPCRPTQFGGYPPEKTQYNNSTLRVFNMLVETSDTKEPKHHLGNSLQVLQKDPANNGHVSRNIRLALLAADLVEPYVSITAVNDLELSDDAIPLTLLEDATTCQRTKGVMIPQNAGQVTVEWTVGGALSIDETSLLYGKWSDLSDDIVNCMAQPNTESVLSKLQPATDQNAPRGTGYFSQDGPFPPPTNSQSGDTVLGPIFRATLDVSNYKVHDEIVVLARARVDQSWQTTQPSQIKPNVPPQAHVVNARTNPEWHHESAGKIIHGRLDWYTTIPLTIVIGDYKDSIGKQAGRQVGTVELSNRFGHSTGSTKGGIAPSSAKGHDLTWRHLLGLFIVLACGGVACAVIVHYRQHGFQHERLAVNELLQEEEEEAGFSNAQPYSDEVYDEDYQVESDEEEEEGGGDLELRPID